LQDKCIAVRQTLVCRSRRSYRATAIIVKVGRVNLQDKCIAVRQTLVCRSRRSYRATAIIVKVGRVNLQDKCIAVRQTLVCRSRRFYRAKVVIVRVSYLNSSPQLRHLCGSLTNRNNSESKQVKGAPITATRMAHNGTVPLTTLVELHRTQSFAGTTGRAFGCGAG
jgi:hypothetical protein